MALPQVSIDGTNGGSPTSQPVVAYFTGIVPVGPGVVETVFGNGASQIAIDTGVGHRTRGVNVRAVVTSLIGADVTLSVQTSDDLANWFDAAQPETGVAQIGDNLIHFATQRRWWRMAWRTAPGSIIPDGNTPPDYPAGTYELQYLQGCYSYLSGTAGYWETAVNITNADPVRRPGGNGTSPSPLPVASTPQLAFNSAPTESQAAIEAYFAGYTQSFAHPGGPIGIYAQDNNTTDDINGTTPATWALQAEFGIMTFFYEYCTANTI